MVSSASASDSAPHSVSPPRLFVRTTALSDDDAARLSLHAPGGLLALVKGCHDVVSWVRDGQGIVGLGRALTLRARGPERIAVLRAAWRATVYASWWRDPMVRPGTGPVALGTIAFSASSQADSVLVVPRVIIGKDDAGAWLTYQGLDESALPSPADLVDALVSSSHRALPQADPGTEGGWIEPSRSQEAYESTIAAVQARMAAGEVSKVVIARDVSAAPARPVDVGTVLSRLGRDYPSCWTFAVDGMIGASPELLVRLAGRRLSSRVLAGTARRHAGTPAQREAEAQALSAWLSTSAKNRREHELARTSALAALDPLCSLVQAPTPYILRLPNVLHLASDITGVVAGDTGALSLVGALHPTAAVGGTPTAAAQRVIAEEEGMDRGRYAGPVGWVDWHGEGEWCIALRSGQMSGPIAGPDHPVRVFGGGGIMPDSVALDELAETRAKMRPMLSALGLEDPA